MCVFSSAAKRTRSGRMQDMVIIYPLWSRRAMLSEKLQCCHSERSEESRSEDFPRRARFLVACGSSEWQNDRAGSARRLAMPSARVWPSGNRAGIPIHGFRSSIPCPLMPLSMLRRQPRDCRRKTRGRAVHYSFPVRLFHPRLHAGLSRRSSWHRFIQKTRTAKPPVRATSLTLSHKYGTIAP